MSSARYAVSQKIDAGGMAEIWMGRARTNDGFVRPVAIKRILPHLVNDEHFARLFLDEARITLKLSHGNLVQTLDVGSAAGVHYLVMEWVDGLNLRSFLRQVGPGLALGPATYIARQVLEGLAYAHDATDLEGEPLQIVHRDISPPNVLLSRHGEVKVADFGLARARGRISRTRPGIIQGKYAYMCPELVAGEPVDRRADLFAVGILLWEMLAGARLFRADSDAATLDRVRACEVPPLPAMVPPVVAAVVMRALARDPDARYPTARALHDALTDALPLDAVRFTGFDLADLVAEVMPDAPPDVIAPPLFVDVPTALVAQLGRVAPHADLLDALTAGIERLEAQAGIDDERRSGSDRRKRRRAPGGRRHTDRSVFVDRVLVLLDAGMGNAEVAEHLNAEGLTTRTNTPWTAKAIAQLARRARQRRRASGDEDASSVL